MTNQLSGVGAITVFVADRHRSKAFYENVFRAKLLHEDEASVVFDLGNTMLNLLEVPFAGSGRRSGSRLAVDAVHLGRRRRHGVRGSGECRCDAAQRPDRSGMGQADGLLHRSRRNALGDRPGPAGSRHRLRSCRRQHDGTCASRAWATTGPASEVWLMPGS